MNSHDARKTLAMAGFELAEGYAVETWKGEIDVETLSEFTTLERSQSLEVEVLPIKHQAFAKWNGTDLKSTNYEGILKMADRMASKYILGQVMSLKEAAESWGVNYHSLRKKNSRGGFFESERKLSEGVWLVTRSGMERVYGQPEESKDQISLLEDAGFKHHPFKESDCWFRFLVGEDLLSFFANHPNQLNRIKSGEYNYLFLELYPSKSVALYKEFQDRPGSSVLRDPGELDMTDYDQVMSWLKELTDNETN